ncbi:rap guanine nucleotide exchange factor 5b [Astyanax mexicanus]|uniref:rap guanine nucleotide exchange factor 5b n=1 Tax=Astyanax mexicanus TaxID=7994 RepID=UPI0020CAB7A0|nr:rap guanine nucleotide exchange factor 5b [Astyanax mexicanus]
MSGKVSAGMAVVKESPATGKTGFLSWRWSWSPVRAEESELKRIRTAPAVPRPGPVPSPGAMASEKQPPEPPCRLNPGAVGLQACVRSIPCAGRALRNAFLSNGHENWKAHVKLARIIKRSFVGLELVQWLMEQSVCVQSRSTAAGVWNVLLEHQVLLSVERQAEFKDSSSLYQFSFEECEAHRCEFRNQNQWQSGVSLLVQLVPLTQLRGRTQKPQNDQTERITDPSSPAVQMRALERLTSTVQNELVVALARKAKSKSMIEDSSPDRRADPTASTPRSSEEKNSPQAGYHHTEDIRRIEVVQKLAKVLQSPIRTIGPPAEPVCDAAVRVCVREGERVCVRGEEMLLLHKTTSPPAPSSTRKRYSAFPATPQNVLEHILSHLRLDQEGGSPQAGGTETLLDDFLLTYPMFMTTSDLCQALLGHYCLKRGQGKEEGAEALDRKQKVLRLLSHWSSWCRNTLQDDEHTKLFLKTLYRYVLDDLYEFPSLEAEQKELQKLLRLQRRHTVDEYSPQRKNKALFHQLSLREGWQPVRAPPRDSKEVLCRMYVTGDSYVSVRTHSAVTVQELLAAVAERLEWVEEDMVLVALTYTREKVVLQPQQCVDSDVLSAAGRLCVCRRDLTQIMSPVMDNSQMQQPVVRMLGMNTWDMAVALTNCDWSLFSNLQEKELVYFTLSRDSCAGHTVALELLLQRCNEVQQWVMTEVLLCPALCKRVQLLKKFIKIAAHCKAQRNLNSFFAIIMGLNTAAISRLSQTWEKVPGKFKKLFSELESLTDPSFNHKAYRDAFKKMKSPKIPFLPLLLKDITFIHEGNKTFLDKLVNFEKLHMIADMVRIIRQCQADRMGNMLTQKDSPEVKGYINYLYIIDNQQTLFELSNRLEPKV